MYKKFLSRKFIMALLVFIAAVVFLALGKLDGGHFTTIVTADIVIFEAANAYAKGRE